jgi:Uma2 family endonuclease
MVMPAPLQEWTAEMVRALPDDGNRYEVLDGALFVTPAPRLVHQWALLDLFRQIDRHVEREQLGRTLLSPADIEYSPRRLVQPDLFVVPFRPGQPPVHWRDIRDLLLVVEVLSPGTAYADRHRKRRIYLEEGVPDYWIVDLDARLVERWRAGNDRPDICEDQIVWRPSPDREPLVITLPPFFAAVPGGGSER